MASARKRKRRTFDLDIRRRSLSNGLTLLALRTSAAPTLAVACDVEVDRYHETARQAGIAHLLGETLDEGTESHSADELAELIESYGGSLRTAGRGAAVQTAAADAKVAVRVLSEVVRRPTFPADRVRRAKALVIADIQSDLDEPRTVAGLAFRELVYGDHPLGRPAKGTVESVSKLTPAQLRKFHARVFVPAQARIAAVGDIEPEEILDLIEKRFGSWKGKSLERAAVAEPSENGKSRTKHIPYDRAQVQVYLGHLGIKREDPDFYKLVVMDHILGSGPGFTSRIARKLRDEQGLCYSVGAGITTSAGKSRGLFSAYIGTSPENREVAIDGFLAELTAIRETLPAKHELDDVKAYLTGSFVWALERNSSLAGFLLRLERFELGDDYLLRYPEIIEAVTRRDVREVAKRHLHPERAQCVTLGPEAS